MITEKTIDYLKSLDSYSCDINMKIENDKQTINYTGKQFYDKKYGYRFELDKVGADIQRQQDIC